MKINIETIPHNKQRYETVGDYWIDDHDVIQMRVSAMGNQNYEFLVILHELIEMQLVKNAGIPFKVVDNFDKDFEQLRKPGDTSEPGDDPKSPYKKQHLIATGVEKIVAAELNEDWQTYDKTVNDL